MSELHTETFIQKDSYLYKLACNVQNSFYKFWGIQQSKTTIFINGKAGATVVHVYAIFIQLTNVSCQNLLYHLKWCLVTNENSQYKSRNSKPCHTLWKQMVGNSRIVQRLQTLLLQSQVGRNNSCEHVQRFCNCFSQWWM